MNTKKADLRQALKQSRVALGAPERQAKSAAISETLQTVVTWSQIATMHFFEPIKKFGEVNIMEFIMDLQAKYPGLQLFTSKEVDGSWMTVSWHDNQISTPIYFDVIIVPMLGFDPATLHRVGYGGGFYDRFLATQPNAKKIGVCFELGRLNRIPAEPHDAPLDTIITELDVY